MNKIFTLSENHNPNYLARIVKIDNIDPIDGADSVAKTVVAGYDIVIDKNKTNIGDIMVYFPLESSINLNFLGANNQFSLSAREYNANYTEVEKLMNSDSEENKASAKRMCGFFEKHGRVRTVTLRKQPSQGFVMPVSSFENWKSELKLSAADFEKLVGSEFDTVLGDIICKKYVPRVKANENTPSDRKNKKRLKQIKKFDRLIPEQFSFHYDTNMLNVNMHKFTPDTIISITKKLHGSSFITANILCNKKLNIVEKIKKLFGAKIDMTEYSNIYASRSVIKNRYINSNVNSFYDVDLWGYVNEILKPVIEKNMTIYGEVVGFIPGKDSMIQKNHDYSINLDKTIATEPTRIMPYRITMNDEWGNKTEYDVDKVYDWTMNVVKNYPEIANHLLPIQILYLGRFGDLYPEILEDENWNANVLAKMKLDKTKFHMEIREPMCKNKVPTEGIVVRIMGDKLSEAFKLKTDAHYKMETKELDEGIVDLETSESIN